MKVGTKVKRVDGKSWKLANACGTVFDEHRTAVIKEVLSDPYWKYRLKFTPSPLGVTVPAHIICRDRKKDSAHDRKMAEIQQRTHMEI